MKLNAYIGLLLALLSSNVVAAEPGDVRVRLTNDPVAGYVSQTLSVRLCSDKSNDPIVHNVLMRCFDRVLINHPDGGTTFCEKNYCIHESQSEAKTTATPELKWNLMTVTYGGKVSLIQNITLTQCEKMRDELVPPLDCGPQPTCSRTQMVNDGDIHTAKCFQ